MRKASLLVPLAVLAATLVPACSQTPVVVPLRSMERPRDVDFICLEDTGRGTFRGARLEQCAAKPDGTAATTGPFRLHAVVTQVSRGELAVVDIGRVPRDNAALVKVDPRVPGYSFIPVGAVPTDVVADPMGEAVYVSSGRDPRIDILPAEILRGPIDTATVASDPPPWPHLEFDRATEGVPSAMSVRREGESRWLYVTLPGATPSPKIAVFDLASPLVPARIGDIPLGAPAPAPLPYQPIACGPSRGSTMPVRTPWWTAYENCVGGKPAPGPAAVTVEGPFDHHLAGVAMAAGKLFVSDDAAPVIHVYDAKGGVELRQLAVGAPTARLAVSPVVPDEVTIQNAAAIDVCQSRGWVGDGLDHSAESPTVKALLNGRCRAHRYIYAIDLVNAQAGSGSIAVIDLPVTYELDAANKIKLTPEGVPANERLDLDGAELVQPMACDAPTFSATRLPVGPFGVGGVNTVPARSVAFIETDPPIANRNVKAARCRPFAPNARPFGHADLSAADGVTAEDRAARIAAGEAWRTDRDNYPRRLRGVFAWIALSNGALTVVDVDDYDALCRGPKTTGARSNTFLYPGEQGVGLGDFASDEYFPRVVQRHHPRSFRAFAPELVPAVSAPILSRFNNVLANDPAAESSQIHPHFAALAPADDDTGRPQTVLPAPDNPYAMSTEAWTVTFEGPLPGFTGAFGALADEGGTLTLSDPSGAFCRRGVESDGPVNEHDVVQLLDDVCKNDGSCTPAQKSECLATFGESTAQPLPKTRSLVIDKSFDDRLVLANKRFQRRAGGGTEDFDLVDGAPDLAAIKRCFGQGLLRYTVRSTGSWVVVGSASGFLHRKVIDPASPEKACVVDASRPRIQQGRVRELPALTRDQLPPTERDPLNAALVTDPCQRFINPTWQFAIRAGTAPSRQDMRFAFSGRFNWQPLSIGAGSLTASMRPVTAYWDGRERLGWDMIAVVDAIDRGLLMFPAVEPFAYQKGAN